MQYRLGIWASTLLGLAAGSVGAQTVPPKTTEPAPKVTPPASGPIPTPPPTTGNPAPMPILPDVPKADAIPPAAPPATPNPLLAGGGNAISTGGQQTISLFGDPFGGRGGVITSRFARYQVFVGDLQPLGNSLGGNVNSAGQFTLTQNPGTVSVIQLANTNPNPSPANYPSLPASLSTVRNSALGFRQDFSGPATFTTVGTYASVQGALMTPDARVAIVNNPAYAALVAMVFQNRASASKVPALQNKTTVVNVTQENNGTGLATFAAAQPAPQSVAQPVAQPVDTSSPSPRLVNQRTINYDAIYTYDVTQQGQSPNANVGRTKLSDDNSPLPTDRFIFNFDYFSNARLGGLSGDVNRFNPGFEKTFLDGMASIEFRLPFASTLSNNIQADGSIRSNEVLFGNATLTLKAMLHHSDTFTVSAGTGFAFPTAPDNHVLNPDGSELARIRNGTFDITPFAAVLYTPGQHLFMQAWTLVTFDATGNAVLANLPTTDADGNATSTGLRGIGRLYDQTQLSIDTQIGYWLIVPGSRQGFLQGLAPFLELHYNANLNRADTVTSPDGSFTINNQLGNYDELNLSAGITTQLRNDMLLTLGAAVPLRQNNNKFFDYQIGLRFNWLYGASARERGIPRVNNY